MANEGDLIQFSIVGSDPDGDNLVIQYSSHDLPDNVEFNDRGDGSGTFAWQTDYDDEEEYTASFVLTDGDFRNVEQIFITIHNTNRSPEIVQGIDDVEFDEDTGPWEITRIDQVFRDPDGDDLEFSVEVNDPLSGGLDEATLLTISAQDNFNAPNGMQVIVTATDVLDSATSDTFLIVINSINDLPIAFNLFQPSDSAEVADYPTITFSWEESVDEVEDDNVTYSLVLIWNDEEHWLNDIDRTSDAVPREAMSFDPQQSTELTWYVFAYDSEDSVRSDQTFQLTVAPLSVRSYVDDIIPSKLTLGSIHPNPFNPCTNINFALPQLSYVRLSVMDASGRFLCVILSNQLSAGRHSVIWDANNLPNGIYLFVLDVDGEKQVTKGVLIR
ncbi:MAG: T9SS type A sorting domain-containing protein [Candidatus Hatepunaea meridiana]|nr:T9SS type A sorting domain-containing protein [Candidatus Hatepunaea meridiana]